MFKWGLYLKTFCYTIVFPTQSVVSQLCEFSSKILATLHSPPFSRRVVEQEFNEKMLGSHFSQIAFGDFVKLLVRCLFMTRPKTCAKKIKFFVLALLLSFFYLVNMQSQDQRFQSLFLLQKVLCFLAKRLNLMDIFL